MKLDRNISPDGRGKYAILNLRRLHEKTLPNTRTPNPVSTPPSDESVCLVRMKDGTVRDAFFVHSGHSGARGWHHWEGGNLEVEPVPMSEQPEFWGWKDPDSAAESKKINDAVELLHSSGILSFGNEPTEDQFFVMKYGDAFTPGGLSGYASAVRIYVQFLTTKRTRLRKTEDSERRVQALKEVETEIVQMIEYALQIEHETVVAGELKGKIPN